MSGTHAPPPRRQRARQPAVTLTVSGPARPVTALQFLRSQPLQLRGAACTTLRAALSSCRTTASARAVRAPFRGRSPHRLDAFAVLQVFGRLAARLRARADAAASRQSAGRRCLLEPIRQCQQAGVFREILRSPSGDQRDQLGPGAGYSRSPASIRLRLARLRPPATTQAQVLQAPWPARRLAPRHIRPDPRGFFRPVAVQFAQAEVTQPQHG